MKEVSINTDTIKLDQLLKWSGDADSGVSAKQMIIEGLVHVNGAVVIQRNKKIHRGDVINIDSHDEFVVI